MVTYTLEYEGVVHVIENVPARVVLETGEKLFAPNVAKRLQQLIWSKDSPTCSNNQAVYNFAE